MDADSLDGRAEARSEKILREFREHDPAVFAKLGPRDVLRVAIHGSAFLAERLALAEQRTDDLERRLLAFERRLESERKGFYYRGTWGEGESYDEGDFVTDHGSMWACLAPTTTRPGTSDAWQLAVKSGRDRRR